VVGVYLKLANYPVTLALTDARKMQSFLQGPICIVPKTKFSPRPLSEKPKFRLSCNPHLAFFFPLCIYLILYQQILFCLSSNFFQIFQIFLFHLFTFFPLNDLHQPISPRPWGGGKFGRCMAGGFSKYINPTQEQIQKMLKTGAVIKNN
jgi:hypothetical protein